MCRVSGKDVTFLPDTLILIENYAAAGEEGIIRWKVKVKTVSPKEKKVTAESGDKKKSCAKHKVFPGRQSGKGAANKLFTQRKDRK